MPLVTVEKQTTSISRNNDLPSANRTRGSNSHSDGGGDRVVAVRGSGVGAAVAVLRVGQEEQCKAVVLSVHEEISTGTYP